MPIQQTYDFDVFISNSPSDQSWVDTVLIPRLRSIGLRIDVTYRINMSDANERNGIIKHIEEAQYLIAVLSPSSLTDQQAQFEWETALNRNYLERRFGLLPVKIADIEEHRIPKQLAALSTVDFTQPDKLEKAFAHLLWVWK